MCPFDGRYSLKIPPCAIKAYLTVYFFVCSSTGDLHDVSDPGESESQQECMRMKWENLSKDLNTKMQLLFNTMQEEQLGSVHEKMINASTREHTDIIFDLALIL